MQMSSCNHEIRRQLHEAKEAGDISLSQYLKELRSLRNLPAGHAASSSSYAEVEGSSDDDDLVDENMRAWKR